MPGVTAEATSRWRAVAIGHQGFANVGDEAILSGIERLLAGSRVSVVAVIAGDRAPVTAFPNARRLTSRRLLPTLAAARALRGAGVLLLAGGGLLHDHWPMVIPRYLAWTLLARALGARVAWVGVGVGPLRSRRARWLIGAAARIAAVRTVRDEPSLALLRGVPGRPSATVIPDPAFFLDPPGPDAARDGLGVIVRGPTPGDAHLGASLRAAILDLVRPRVARGERVELLAMADDTELVHELAAASDDGAGRRAGARVLPLDGRRAVEELAGYDRLVSLRLHGLILAALAATPCVPVSYDPKVSSVARQLGLADVTVALGDLDAPRLESALAAVGERSVRRRVAASVTRLRGERQRVVEVLERALDG